MQKLSMIVILSKERFSMDRLMREETQLAVGNKMGIFLLNTLES